MFHSDDVDESAFKDGETARKDREFIKSRSMTAEGVDEITVNVLPWLSRTALDIIGIGKVLIHFDFDCQILAE